VIQISVPPDTSQVLQPLYSIKEYKADSSINLAS
jgi:hypothetical protein